MDSVSGLNLRFWRVRRSLQLAKRLEEIAPFRVMELMARANELAASGHDVIHLEVGEPDFATPAPIIEAAQNGLQLGMTKYTDARGTLALRRAISAYYSNRFAVDVDPDRIFVTAGASGGLLLLIGLLVNAGENLLLADPGYPCNRHFLASFEAEGRLVPVTASDNYQLTPKAIDYWWNDQTRGILVATPANPTGSVINVSDLARLHDSVRARDGYFLVDEIYQGLSEQQAPSQSALSVSDDLFVINSFSKFFGMTGWRLGWVVVPEACSRDLEKLAQNLFICPSAIAQHAALAAFSESALEIMEGQRLEFARRRNFLVPALRELGFDIPRDPEGAFYVYCGLPESVEDAETFCRRLLETEFVAITPGTDFGFFEADQKVRISFSRDMAELEEAVERIARVLR